VTAYAPRLPRLGTLAAWRDAARRLVAARVPPEAVDWGLEDAPAPLFGDAVGDLPAPARALRVPRAFPALAECLIPERAGEGLSVAYALLLRLQAEPRLLENRADRDVARAEAIAKSIRRDRHKMHAFVRFRELEGARDRRAFTAWFEPDHRIEELATPFFARRFGDMDWEIVTPEVVTTFAAGALSHAARPTPRPALGDPMEGLWTTYYSSIFNPARLKPAAMRSEMPVKYWRNLPEAWAIPSLIETAHARAEEMRLAAPTLPPPQALRRQPEELAMKMPAQSDLFGSQSLPEIAESASACTRCPLHEHATQVVFGEGPRDADVMIVGEQPGDKEDLAGRPFVGPAGQLFDAVAQEARLDRGTLYVTNAVKHFKFEQRGRRRIHQKPAASEVSACRWWLEQELASVDPRLVVAMGATALHALTGSGAGILKRRGGVETTKDGRPCLVTVHPSYLLRLPDEEVRRRETDAFRRDLERVPDLLAELAG
jgi:DNA polymerase